MTELLINGNFEGDISSWVQGAGGTIDHQDAPSHETGGCARLVEETPASGTCYIEQQVAIGSMVGGVQGRWYRLKFALQSADSLPEADAAASAWFEVRLLVPGAVENPIQAMPLLSELDKYHEFVYDVFLSAQATSATLRFTANLELNNFYLDDVSFATLTTDSTGSCGELAWELANLRADRAMVKHPESRYQAAVAQAMREAPIHIWPTDINTSLTTVDEQRRYALAAITDLDEVRQLLSVWMEDTDDGHFYQRGRWHVEDDAGTLTLVFHEDPDEAWLTIRLEYAPTMAALDCADPTDTTNLDRDWLIARAMTVLLLEADPQIEDPAWLMAQLNTWDLKRQARESQLRPKHRSKRKTVTQRWS